VSAQATVTNQGSNLDSCLAKVEEYLFDTFGILEEEFNK
jgi:hypothetical protein